MIILALVGRTIMASLATGSGRAGQSSQYGLCWAVSGDRWAQKEGQVIIQDTKTPGLAWGQGGFVLVIGGQTPHVGNGGAHLYSLWCSTVHCAVQCRVVCYVG